MQLRALVVDCITLAYQRVVNESKDLTPTQLRWQPTPETNHAGFLLFHVFRGLDLHFHQWLSPQGELWVRNKWGRHFVLPTAPANVSPSWSTGNSWTPAEVAAFQVPPVDQLLAYGESVYQSAMRKLSALDLADLARKAADPSMTMSMGSALTIAAIHVPQHGGQIEYLVGLMRERGIT